jgi:hypothetical protein
MDWLLITSCVAFFALCAVAAVAVNRPSDPRTR